MKGNTIHHHPLTLFHLSLSMQIQGNLNTAKLIGSSYIGITAPIVCTR